MIGRSNVRFLGDFAVQPSERVRRTPAPGSSWRNGLPALTGERVLLREIQAGDAPALLEALTAPDVTRYISPPPATLEGFQAFIDLAQKLRAAGTYICYAIAVPGSSDPVGLFQVRQTAGAFRTAEWSFAARSTFWGTGMFEEGAGLLLDFLFPEVGIHRLEARAAVTNALGNGALRKVGAIQEGILRQSFLRNGQYLDEVLWAMLHDDWVQVRRASGRAH